MGQFSQFQNILPDPNNGIGAAGQGDSSKPGPGFATVKLSSEQPYLQSRTNSGRLIARGIAYHKWKINITYNPMTREEFEPIYTFLLQRRGPLNPFYVSLPQYRTPQNSSFAAHVASNDMAVTDTSYAAGSTIMSIDGGSDGNYTRSSDGTPQPGDLFTVAGSNSNHQKAYMVTRMETAEDYEGSQPNLSQSHAGRMHFVPGLAKSVNNNDELKFHNPLIKVIRVGNVEEYSLNANNLYQFSLNLEEVQ